MSHLISHQNFSIKIRYELGQYVQQQGFLEHGSGNMAGVFMG